MLKKAGICQPEGRKYSGRGAQKKCECHVDIEVQE